MSFITVHSNRLKTHQYGILVAKCRDFVSLSKICSPVPAHVQTEQFSPDTNFVSEFKGRDRRCGTLANLWPLQLEMRHVTL